MTVSVLTKDAPLVWKCLKGLFCIYKDSDKNMHFVRNSMVTNICRSLNELEVRPPNNYIAIEESPTSENYHVLVRPDYADHPLVVGPRYQSQDVRLTWATHLSSKCSGLVVMAINQDSWKAQAFNKTRPLRTYHLKGILGQACTTMYKDGRIVRKVDYKHVQQRHLDRVLATYQAAHQKQMFLQSGVDIQSQTAYELSTKGLIRPPTKNVPLIYNFKTIDFESPNFTIEIQCINENENYLLSLIHDIGTRLRTHATCTGLRCIQQGCFSVEHALLRKHWTAEYIINNITLCDGILKESGYNLYEHNPFLSSNDKTINQALP